MSHGTSTSLSANNDGLLPHSVHTAEELLRLFHTARAGPPCSVDSVLTLARSDRAFASNLSRMLEAEGLVFDEEDESSLREALAKFTPLRAVAVLGTVEPKRRR